ncbi:MAG: hypothetical protein KDA45_11825 [Planctomycetales bacterium]|nr:hypothetical protein [Planctomycetales bacterium]
MQSIRTLLLIVAVHLPLTAACVQGQDGSERQVVKLSGEGFGLEVFDNSPTISQAIAINASGQLLGEREVADAAGTIFSPEFFFVDGQQSVTIPRLEGFSHIEMQALSDSGVAVGYASRRLRHPEGSLIGVVWDSGTNQLSRLPPLPGDVSSHGQDISSDGQLVTGYSTGPGRLRPCLWQWRAESKDWVPQTLPVLLEYNPFLMSAGVLISPNGQRIAACITVEELPNNLFDSSLYMWEMQGDEWLLKPLSDEQMHLKDLNDAGEMACALTVQNLRQPCHIDSRGKLTRIALFPGDVSGEARGIDAEGTVVGFSDAPHGPEGGPRAFVWRNGQTESLALPASSVFSAAMSINDRGQIAGMLDVTLPAPEQTGDAAEEPQVKTLAFRWSPPAKQNKP